MKNIFTIVIAFTAVAFTSQAQNTWTQKSDVGYDAPNFAAPTARSGAVGFSIGSKGYIGTGNDGAYKKDFWEYDPDANTWSQKADFGGQARQSATGFSIGSKGYIGLGTFYDAYFFEDVFFDDFWEYDPNYNTWIQKAFFPGISRYSATGFNIGSKGYIGTGYVDDGYDAHYLSKDFWEYDPDANIWIQKADFGGSARLGAVGFSIGNRGYLGTGTSGQQEKDFWEYNPDLNSWMQKADFGGGKRSLAAGFSIGSKGYIGTGSMYDGTEHFYNDFWEYDPDVNPWMQKADFGGAARYEAAGFSIGNKGYLGTGSVSGNNKDFWEYNGDTNVWTQKKDFGNTAQSGATGFSVHKEGYILGGQVLWKYDPKMNSWEQKADFAGVSRNSAVSFSIGSKGYVGTGYSTDGYKKDFWEYDANANSWKQKSDFGGSARYQATGFSIGNKGYIGTGYATGYTKDFWEFDPDNNTWSQKADFGGTSRYAATGFSINSKGYIGSGRDGFGYKKDFWEYDPNENMWTQKADFGGASRIDAVGFSINNKGYVGTGYSSGILSLAYYSDFWEFDPGANTWIVKAYFGGVGRSGSTGFSIGNKGYIGTGYSTDNNGAYTYNYKDFWEYTPDGYCAVPSEETTTNITATSAQLNWDEVTGGMGYAIQYKAAGISEWTIIKSVGNNKMVAGLAPNTKYKWGVKTICSTHPIVASDWSAKQFFTTLPLKITNENVETTLLEIYPNPFSSSTTISFSLHQNSPVQIELLEVTGRKVTALLNENVTAGNPALSAGKHEINLNREQLSAGIYFIKVLIDGEVMMKKVVVE